MPNRKSEIQIVDTHETSETRSTIGFIAEQHQLNRTVVQTHQSEVFALFIPSGSRESRGYADVP
jgi:hypothetical protein